MDISGLCKLSSIQWHTLTNKAHLFPFSLSPIAVYHEKTDQVLILDVARFKYQPYFCSVTDLYNAMTPKDAVSFTLFLHHFFLQ
jgi:hypothetical protein